jgi:hypothetical protein
MVTQPDKEKHYLIIDQGTPEEIKIPCHWAPTHRISAHRYAGTHIKAHVIEGHWVPNPGYKEQYKEMMRRAELRVIEKIKRGEVKTNDVQ